MIIPSWFFVVWWFAVVWCIGQLANIVLVEIPNYETTHREKSGSSG